MGKVANKLLWVLILLAILIGYGAGLLVAKRGEINQPTLAAEVYDIGKFRGSARAAALEGEKAAEKIVADHLQKMGTVDDLINTVHFGWLMDAQYAVAVLAPPKAFSSGNVLRIKITGNAYSEQQVIDTYRRIDPTAKSSELIGWRTHWR